MGGIKRFCSVLIMMVFSVQCLALEPALAEEFALGMNYTAKASFDKGKIAAETGKINGSNITAVRSGDLSVMQANATMTAANFTVTAEDPQKREATLISFDIMADTAVTRGYMHVIPKSLENVESKYRALYFMDTGKIGFFSSFMEAGAGVGTDKYSANQWYHFDMWFDYTELEVYYYIDGKELYSVPLTEEFDGVAGFKFVVEVRNGGGTYQFDNIKIVDFPQRGGKIEIDGVTVPEHLTLPVTLGYDTAENELGFNFTSGAVSFAQTLTNVTDAARKVRVDIAVTDDEGQTVAHDEYYAELAAKERISKKAGFRLSGYGFYTLQTTVIDAADNSQISRSELGLLSAAGAGLYRSGHDARTATLGTAANYALNDTYTRYNQIIEENGARPFVLLTREGGKYPPVTTSEYQEWKEYLTGIAMQFKGKKPIYEVWNEYNIPSFNYNNATVENYVNMLKTSYETIKKIDPDAVICGFAVAPALKPAYELSGQDWMRLVLDAGGREYMDMASLHLYTNNIPEDFSSERGRLITDTRKMLDERGLGHIKLMTSEMGWSTGSSVDEQTQAQYIVRYAALTNDKLEYTAWYVDQDKQTASGSENGYGFMRAWSKAYSNGCEPYSAKPALLAFSNWNALMTGAVTEKELEHEYGGTHIYRYLLPDSKRALLVWNETGEKKTISLKLDTDRLDMYDIYGNKTELTGLNGEFCIDYSGSMVYLIGNFNTSEVCESKFVNLTRELSISRNDTASIVFRNNSGEVADVVLDLPENISERGRAGDMITLAAGGNPQQGEKIHVSIKSGGWLFSCIAWSFGVDFMEQSEDGKWTATFNTPEAVEALSWVKDLKWKHGVLPSNTLIDNGEYYKLFATGNAGMLITGAGVPSSVVKYGMSPDKLGMMALPRGPKRHVTLLGGRVWGMSENSTADQIDAAIRWTETSYNFNATDDFKTTAENNIKLALENNQLVGIKGMSVWSDDAESAVYESKLIDENANCNLNHVRLYNEFVKSDVEIQPEEPVCAQELYGVLDGCIQEVLTNENADCGALIEGACRDFQRDYLDNLTY